MKKITIILIASFLIFLPFIVSAQSTKNSQNNISEVETVKAKVLDISNQSGSNVYGAGVQSGYQKIDAQILEGKEKGKIVSVENDYISLEVGDIFYLTHTVNSAEGINDYEVFDAYRLPWLYGLIGLFVVCVLIFGGKQGIRGLLALILSFIFIIYLLFPGILHGFSPILISISVASLIIILGSYITHGFNRVTTSAVIGMVITLIFTGALAFVSIRGAKLTGFTSEEAMYLNINTNGSIDFSGLLLGGIIIGLLGVLYDAAIGQSVAVDELHDVGPHLSQFIIFRRALRIGREHIGALVNMLAIAYVGAALPLLLLFYQESANFSLTINREIFATEIVRIMVSSIGLILAVPITTAIATLMIVKEKKITNDTGEIIADEIKKVENLEHKH